MSPQERTHCTLCAPLYVYLLAHFLLQGWAGIDRLFDNIIALFQFVIMKPGLYCICLHESGFRYIHSKLSSFCFSFQIERSIRNDMSIHNRASSLHRDFTLQ